MQTRVSLSEFAQFCMSLQFQMPHLSLTLSVSIPPFLFFSPFIGLSFCHRHSLFFSISHCFSVPPQLSRPLSSFHSLPDSSSLSITPSVYLSILFCVPLSGHFSSTLSHLSWAFNTEGILHDEFCHDEFLAWN